MDSRVETPVLVLCGKGFADWSVSPAPEECSGLSTPLPECIYIETLDYHLLPDTDPCHLLCDSPQPLPATDPCLLWDSLSLADL